MIDNIVTTLAGVALVAGLIIGAIDRGYTWIGYIPIALAAVAVVYIVTAAWWASPAKP